MQYDEYEISVRESLQQKYPALWTFMDAVDFYAGDTPEDLSCKRWQDILTLACFIRTTDCGFRCEPGKMATAVSREYRDHNSEYGSQDIHSSVTRLSREAYEALRERYTHENYLKFDFSNIFYLGSREKYLEEGYILYFPPETSDCYGRYRLGILARMKEMEGYYLFTFSKE